jgi:acetylornithine deacetylase/succinyl-diaminopimelate desuccinylase-like protein
MSPLPASPIYQNPAELLRQLIRFDTTNPPGNERECILFINELLHDAGIKTTLLGKDFHRQNLVARIQGEGKASPLLLYGHVDVVTTEKQHWAHPPFAADIVDGFIWGRGALDMKSGVAMMLAAFLKAKAEGTSLPGDVIFCAVADEEAGGDFGAKFLVEEHPSLFEGVKYAFGEFGGFNMSISGKRLYPVMVAEKQACWMKATFRGQGGHGSMPVHGQAMAKLGGALRLLDQHDLPYHLTPAVRVMIESIAKALGGVSGLLFRQLNNPLLARPVLKALGSRLALFTPLLHNTVSPTMLTASDKVNVIPGEVELGLDGRLLPGFQPADMERELRLLLGADFDLEVAMFDPGPAAPDMGLFDTLGAVLHELDREGTAVPLVLSGVTDARFFSKLGIQTYGFTPLKLPDDFSFTHIIHAADERVPAEAVEFGTQAIYKAMQRFGNGG